MHERAEASPGAQPPPVHLGLTWLRGSACSRGRLGTPLSFFWRFEFRWNTSCGTSDGALSSGRANKHSSYFTQTEELFGEVDVGVLGFVNRNPILSLEDVRRFLRTGESPLPKPRRNGWRGACPLVRSRVIKLSLEERTAHDKLRGEVEGRKKNSPLCHYSRYTSRDQSFATVLSAKAQVLLLRSYLTPRNSTTDLI